MCKYSCGNNAARNLHKKLHSDFHTAFCVPHCFEQILDLLLRISISSLLRDGYECRVRHFHGGRATFTNRLVKSRCQNLRASLYLRIDSPFVARTAIVTATRRVRRCRHTRCSAAPLEMKMRIKILFTVHITR